MGHVLTLYELVLIIKIRVVYVHLVLAPINNSNNSTGDTNSYWIEICETYSDQKSSRNRYSVGTSMDHPSQEKSRGKIISSLFSIRESYRMIG